VRGYGNFSDSSRRRVVKEEAIHSAHACLRIMINHKFIYTMEKINKLLQHFSLEKMKVSFKSLAPGISIMILVAFLNLLFNCSYYKVRTIDPPTNASVTEQVKNREKYIMIHSGEKAWHYKDITLSDSGKEITGVLEPIRSNHLYYLNAKKKSGGHLYKSNPAKTDLPIHEIHIFTFRNLDESAAEVTVPITDIIKLQVYDPDIGAQVSRTGSGF